PDSRSRRGRGLRRSHRGRDLQPGRVGHAARYARAVGEGAVSRVRVDLTYSPRLVASSPPNPLSSGPHPLTPSRRVLTPCPPLPSGEGERGNELRGLAPRRPFIVPTLRVCGEGDRGEDDESREGDRG